MTLILFPSDPLSPQKVDPDFEHERAAALQAGFPVALVDHTRVIQGDAAGAVARVPEGEQPALYRGWMLKPPQYRALHDALLARGVQLITSPDSYRVCHYLPESYPFIENCTPRSVWLAVNGEVNFESVNQALAQFHGRPVIVKDYVKSQKHYWNEACFIPNAADEAAVHRIVTRFLELQGEDLNEGLVFREYVPLRIVGTHPKSGLPLAAELRTFWFHGEPILAHRYWGDLTAFDGEVPLNELRAIATRIPSSFFALDVAFKENGDWTIVELGDGQVTGLPTPELAPSFFRELAAKNQRA